ncbi:hypothetical protein V8E54_004434 [Elaphomyces granulatus]|jgi:hypothetical protein
MGIDDFLNFSDDAFRVEASRWPNEELRRHEIIEYRKIYGARCGIGAGVGLALHTGGISLAGSAVNGRRLDVHKRKLRII